MSPGLLLEVCVDSIEGCLAAAAGGARRVELCADLLEGGITPSPGLIERACARSSLPVMVMVRPRGGDFFYTEEELACMRADLAFARAAGAAGVVLGVLDREGAIDFERTRELVELARPLQVTFHRAFDRVPDPFAALERLVELGVERVLTSGLAPNAPEGAPLLRRLVDAAAGRIAVMPGGGLRPENAAELARASGAREFHASARRCFPSPMHTARPAFALGASGSAPAARDDLRHATDVELVRGIARALAAGHGSAAASKERS